MKVNAFFEMIFKKLLNEKQKRVTGTENSNQTLDSKFFIPMTHINSIIHSDNLF